MLSDILTKKPPTNRVYNPCLNEAVKAPKTPCLKLIPKIIEDIIIAPINPNLKLKNFVILFKL